MHLQQTTVESRINSGSKESRQIFIIPFIDTDEAEAKSKRIQNKNFQGPDFNHSQELVTSAAICLANGSVFTGLFHAEAVEKAHSAFANKSESYVQRLFRKAKDGFLTSKGRFVSSRHAYKIAVSRRQITPKSYARSVEALWGIKPKLGKLNAVAFSDCRIA